MATVLTLMHGEAKTPAKNRHTISAAALLERPHPRMKSEKMVKHISSTVLRPYLSDVANTGSPIARPKRYKEKGSVATSEDTPKSLMNCWRADIMSVAAKVLIVG